MRESTTFLLAVVLGMESAKAALINVCDRLSLLESRSSRHWRALQQGSGTIANGEIVGSLVDDI